jgi:hypothetical protein
MVTLDNIQNSSRLGYASRIAVRTLRARANLVLGGAGARPTRDLCRGLVTLTSQGHAIGWQLDTERFAPNNIINNSTTPSVVCIVATVVTIHHHEGCVGSRKLLLCFGIWPALGHECHQVSGFGERRVHQVANGATHGHFGPHIQYHQYQHWSLCGTYN